MLFQIQVTKKMSRFQTIPVAEECKSERMLKTDQNDGQIYYVL